MYTTNYANLSVSELYKSAYTDFCIKAHKLLQLETYPDAFVDVKFTDYLGGNLRSCSDGDNKNVEILIPMFMDNGDCIHESEIYKNIVKEFIHAKQLISGDLEYHGLVTDSYGCISYLATWKGKDYYLYDKNFTPWHEQTSMLIYPLYNELMNKESL